MRLSGKLAEKGLHAFDHEPHIPTGLKVPRTWIVVADHAEARIYRKTPQGIERIGDAQRVEQIGGAPRLDAKGDPVEVDAGGGVPHGYDPRSQKKHHGDTGFIHHFVEFLAKAEGDRAFDRLVLVAGPRTLGDLRSCLGKNLQARVTAEIDKDLVKSNDKAILEHLEGVAWA